MAYKRPQYEKISTDTAGIAFLAPSCAVVAVAAAAVAVTILVQALET